MSGNAMPAVPDWELLQPAPTEAATGFGAALWPGGKESGPRDQNSGALSCLFICPEKATAQSVLSAAAVPSHLDEPPVECPPTGGHPMYHHSIPATDTEGIHPFLNTTASAPVIANSNLHFEFPSKAHLSLPRRRKPPPPINKAASVFPGFKPCWEKSQQRWTECLSPIPHNLESQLTRYKCALRGKD